MTPYSLKREQFVPRRLDEVFAFFERPENLKVITPPSVGFVILTPLPFTMRQGAVIDYTIKVLGTKRHWTTLISEYDPPHRFVDVQLKGPYRFWHHTHTFEAAKGGTVITDDVRYLLPFGPAGRLANVLYVRKQLQKIFDYRKRSIAEHFGGRLGDAGGAGSGHDATNSRLRTEV